MNIYEEIAKSVRGYRISMSDESTIDVPSGIFIDEVMPQIQSQKFFQIRLQYFPTSEITSIKPISRLGAGVGAKFTAFIKKREEVAEKWYEVVAARSKVGAGLNPDATDTKQMESMESDPAVAEKQRELEGLLSDSSSMLE